ncbi:MAG TPA: 16S rRNA (cytidine(1402)-2'-O)-methyltransferase [Anaerolineaceae bacterium]|nr:16S rRNA (cytidine(1402)-2'-O)-methyltransferase [Anaerolineaceae bacterium]
MKNFGTLYVVATPIGNDADITLRAIEILKNVNAVVCEEAKPGSTLLKKLGIEGKELALLNEHNEEEAAADLLVRLLNGQSLAMISDCGTPVFSDPGSYLIQLASSSGVTVSPIPGASSLMAALSVLDFKMGRFVFAGFLSREPEKRRSELTRYRTLRIPVVLMDTPYRLGALLDDVIKVFGKGIWVTVGYDMTLPTETIYRGEAETVRKQIGPRKGEFIMIVGN